MSLVVVVVGIVLGERCVLRLDDSSSIPLSYACYIVLAGAFGGLVGIATVAAATALALPVRRASGTARERVSDAVHHGLVGFAIVASQACFRALFGIASGSTAAVWSLLVATGIGVGVDAALQQRRHGVSLAGFRGRRAWLAVASCGVLMAVADRGVDGSGALGAGGVLLFSVPLIAAWHSFGRLDAAELVQRQTVEALAMAPELAGRSAPGRSRRVAALCVDCAQILGFEAADVDALESAALLANLGVVTLDDPAFGGPPVPDATIAHVTADMLRAIGPLARSGDIVARAASRRSFTYLDAAGNTAALVLRFAGAIDDLMTHGDDAATALRQLRESVRDDEELRVLEAFDFVVAARA